MPLLALECPLEMPLSIFTWEGRQRARRMAQAREAANQLYRFRRHEWDRLSPELLVQVNTLETRLANALSEKNSNNLEAATKEAEDFLQKHESPRRRSAVRENVEVLVVAIVLALSVRAYFVQPFKIPTGSMEPTLMGIAARPLEGPKPNLLRRVFELVAFGRSYHELQLKQPGLLMEMQPGRVFTWWEYTDLLMNSPDGQHVYRVWINPQVLSQKLKVEPGTYYPAGSWVVRAVTEAGDQVLVNKMAYHFRGPRRGEVFVFRTTGIEMLEERLRSEGVQGSQYYIKRCAAVAGDQVSIQPPLLFVNTKPAKEFGLARVQSGENGYRGYQLADSLGTLLNEPANVVKLPAHTALALGDNSHASFDSRYWGLVPRANLAGAAAIVYWPFGKRWGWVR